MRLSRYATTAQPPEVELLSGPPVSVAVPGIDLDQCRGTAGIIKIAGFYDTVDVRTQTAFHP